MDLVRFLAQTLFVSIAFVILLSVDPLVNIPDLGWHIRTGEKILSSRSLPHSAWFTFSIPDHLWVAHEWMQDILMYLLWSNGGLTAIRFWFAFCGLGFAALGLYLTRDQRTSPLFCAFITIPAAALLVATRALRLQFVTLFLFTLLFILLLELHKKFSWHRAMLIPLIFLIWANLHAGFPAGFLLIAAFSVGVIFEKNWFLMRALVYLGAISLLLTLVNPYGFEIYHEIFQTINDPFPSQIVVEWRPTSLASRSGEAFCAVCIFLLLTIAIKKPRIALAHATTLLFFLFFSLTATRHVVFPIIIGLPLLWLWRDSIRPHIERELRFIFGATVIIAALAALIFVNVSDQPGAHSISKETQLYPVAALNALNGLEWERRLFHNVEWGGYLLLRNPKAQTFIDGRMTQWQVDGKSFLRTYVGIKDAEPGWSDLLNHYRINMVLIKRVEPLAHALSASPNWKETYQDNQAIVFER